MGWGWWLGDLLVPLWCRVPRREENGQHGYPAGGPTDRASGLASGHTTGRPAGSITIGTTGYRSATRGSAFSLPPAALNGSILAGALVRGYDWGVRRRWQRHIRLVLVVVVTAILNNTGCGEEEPRACVDCLAPELVEQIPAELRYERVEIPVEKNAYFSVAEAIRSLPDDCEPPRDLQAKPIRSGEEASELRKVIRRCATSLGLLDEAADRPLFQWPLFGDEVQPLWRVRALLRLKLAQAKLDARGADWHAAGQRVEQVYSLGQHMAEGDPVLIFYLIALGIRSMAEEEIIWLTQQRGVPDKVLRSFVAALEEAEDDYESFRRTMAVELTTFMLPEIAGAPDDVSTLVDLVREAHKESESLAWVKSYLPGGDAALFGRADMETFWRVIREHPKPLDKVATARSLGTAVAARLRDTWGHTPAGLPRTEPASAEEVRPCETAEASEERVADWVREVPNPLGEFLVNVAFRTDYYEEARRSATRREATLQVVALRLYDSKRGEFPERLDALVDSGILRSLPIDPYSGKPSSTSVASSGRFFGPQVRVGRDSRPRIRVRANPWYGDSGVGRGHRQPKFSRM